MPVLQKPGKHSKLWADWRAIGRGDDERFFMEHYEAVVESIASPRPPEQILISSRCYERQPSYWDDLISRGPTAWYLVDGDKLDRVISVRSSSGLCGVYSVAQASLSELANSRFVLVSWEVQDPGNLGTLLRSGAALTGGGALIVGGCRPWSGKVARSSAGALLRMPLCRCSLEEAEGALSQLQQQGFQLFSTVCRGGVTLREVEWPEKVALLIGNETRGLPRSVQDLTSPITIAMEEGAESLNAGVAGSIACYEWSQRALEGQNRISSHG